MEFFLHSKPFDSIGGFKSRYIYYFSIRFWKKYDEKKFGRWTFWLQDDNIEHFSFYPFTLSWATIPDRKFVRDNK